MTKHADSGIKRHPDTVELDRLRTGLLDDDRGARAAIVTHLEICAACRQREAQWSRLVRALDLTSAESDEVEAVWAHRRERRHTERRTRSVYSRLAIAGIAVIAIGVAAVRLINAPRPGTAQTAEAPLPDLYADLDFYLWLMHKQTRADTSPNS